MDREWQREEEFSKGDRKAASETNRSKTTRKLRKRKTKKKKGFEKEK